ncbi:MAG TPA: hypothetical protein VNL73_09475 [Verrucomicrobiae bacterium]|nr:hypothetical protein [Verrucomicrobiae bacterium]
MGTEEGTEARQVGFKPLHHDRKMADALIQQPVQTPPFEAGFLFRRANFVPLEMGGEPKPVDFGNFLTG